MPARITFLTNTMLKINSSYQTKSWEQLLSDSKVNADDLSQFIDVNPDMVSRVIEKYPMRINPYFFSLIQQKGDPIWKQCVPDVRELEDHKTLTADPLFEEPQSPTPGLIHRYPDRVVFMVSNKCAVYCRHCMRKRRVGEKRGISANTISRGIAYIQSNPAIRDVILSGGDPLLLVDDQIEELLTRIHKISHVDMIRIHTRVPCSLPQRITNDLVYVLKQVAPVYINIQFNHPNEITPQASQACGMLADAGIPLGSQTVLLKGVNDDPDIMMDLMRCLLKIRVRPYYLHHGDPVKGTGHFRTTIKKGLEIMRHLRGRLSGIGVPSYMIDLPGGGGKVPLLPEYVLKDESGELTVKNFEGELFKYCGAPRNGRNET
ncbi:MAG: KamA family radical SAM protein [Dissulfuribacterales bacterium]